MEKVISHPEESGRSEIGLVEHSEKVADMMESKIPVSDIKHLGQIIGLLHDITKCKPVIQDALKNDDIYQLPEKHAPTSAVIATSVSLRMDNITDKQSILVYYAISKHHVALEDDIPRYLMRKVVNGRKTSKTKEEIRKISSNKNCKDTFLQLISKATNGEVQTESEVLECIDEFEEKVKEEWTGFVGIEIDRSEIIGEKTYQQLLSIYTALSVSDILHASGAGMNVYGVRPTSHLLEEKISKIPKEDRIDDLREEARKEAIENLLDKRDEGFDIAELHLPTGLGKTYTGLNVGLKMLDEDIEDSSTDYVDSSDNGRIIYVLPYTSIIDQTYNKLSDKFNSNDGMTVSRDHYLSTEEDSDDDERGVPKEMWFNGITVTTYVQLFENLVAPNRYSSAKIPQVKDSVVILDEPQSIPRNWWDLVTEACGILSDMYDCEIISMTATPPFIFRESDMRTSSLIENPEYYHKKKPVKRVKYNIHSSVLNDKYNRDISDVADDISESIQFPIEKSRILSVQNTIRSNNSLMRNIMNRNTNIDVVNEYLSEFSSERTDEGNFNEFVHENSDNDIYILNLSARLRPKDRRRIIDFVRDERSSDLCLVSTQVIEAGVDLSFKQVYRDIAPITSIVQTAGRCNRNKEDDHGQVTVHKIGSQENGNIPPSETIYARDGINLTKISEEILSDRVDGESGNVEQTDFNYRFVREYYERIRDRRNEDTPLVESLNNGEIDEVSDLSFIRDDVEGIDICVFDCVEEMDRLKSLFDDSNYEEAIDEINKHKDKIVSIPSTPELKKQMEQIDPYGGYDLYCTTVDNDYYSYIFGFKSD